jgi:hypothetical protein
MDDEYDEIDEIDEIMDDEDDSDAEETEEEEDIEDVEPHETFDNITVIVVKPENRMTSDMMSLNEFCAILGIRGAQIEGGDDFYADLQYENTSIDIAKKELMASKSPCIVERVVDTKHNIVTVEHWKVSELKLPDTVKI